MFYSFACLVVRAILRAFVRCTVVGVEKLPTTGPFLLVANHLNLIDPPVLGALLPRRVVFMAKEELFQIPLVGLVVKWYGAFAVRRGQPDRQALRFAVSVLQEGGVVGMFPEGTRSKTGRISRALPGASLVALMSRAPIVPVAISGTDRIRSPLSLLGRPTLSIRIGEPFLLERARGGKSDLEEATTQMMARVALLLPEHQRGFYASAADAFSTGSHGSTGLHSGEGTPRESTANLAGEDAGGKSIQSETR